MLAPKIIGNYWIIDCIGSGGMGDVYTGEDIHLKRRVAIKALRQERLNEPEVIERFRMEAVTLARLNHPNVATIYALLEEQNNYYIVMELISGWQLSTFLGKIGALPLSVAFYFFKQVLEGIGSVHAENIVHRDLKPSNIMIDENLIAKVMDFGIARFQTGGRLTRYDKLVGTIEYMSPEQILGKDVNTASDIYSLGILLFEMVTGHLPFSAESDYELMKCQVENPPPILTDFRADIPDKLVNILSRALDKNPQKRFPSAEAFSNAIDEIGINTSNAKPRIQEFIGSHQLENKKTIDTKSPSSVDGACQNPMNKGKSSDIKKQAPSYIYMIFSGFILLLTQRPWLGPLILLLSISTVGGLILMNNPRFSYNTLVQEQIVDEQAGQILRSVISEIEDINPYSSRNISRLSEINASPVKFDNQMESESVPSHENINEDMTGKDASNIQEATPRPINRVQGPTITGSLQPTSKEKASSRQEGQITENEVDTRGISETAKSSMPVKTEDSNKAITDSKEKNNEWIIHK